MITSLNTIINQVYKPLVEKLDANDWGVCEEEQRKDFNHVFDKFSIELKEALKSLQNSLKLEPYNPNWENDARTHHTQKNLPEAMIKDFNRVFDQWREKIRQHCEDADKEKTDQKGAGPRNELDYWKQRMRTYTGISEQLRSKNCKTVYDVLSFASQNQNVGGTDNPRDRIYMSTSEWRSLELRVTESLNEAKDNVKYL